jgi:transcriptional regulator with XRE-family HTH domain
MSHIHHNIKKLRLQKGLTQQQLADTLQMSRAALGAYEERRAEPGCDRLIAIAGYFEITIDQLLTKQL